MDTSREKYPRALTKRMLLFASWADDGNWFFLNSLRALGMHVDVMEPLLIRRKWVPGFIKRLCVRLCPYYQPLLALAKADRYDVVASWSTRIGTFHGIFSRLLPKAKRPLHILRDFHLDFTRFADPVYQVRLLLVRLGVPGVDAFLATSHEESSLYSAIFGINPADIRFYPDTPGGAYMHPRRYPQEEYVFAYGNSDRDFDTLVAASAHFASNVVILSQAYTPQGPLPENVRLITRRVPQEELMALIGGARVVVIPTKSYYVAAGQNAMLEVMCLSRPLVVTHNITTVEHATHEHDALFFPARDTQALAQAVGRLLDAPEAARRMGENGRNTAMACPGQQVDIFLEVLEGLAARQDAAVSGVKTEQDVPEKITAGRTGADQIRAGQAQHSPMGAVASPAGEEVSSRG